MARDIAHVTIVGLGLIGSSVARAVKEKLPGVAVTGHDASADVRAEAREIGFCDVVADDPADAVAEADLVILAVPVGRMADAAAAIAPGLRADAIISDVGSSKSGVADALASALPAHLVIPAHPVAGTENSGPAAGFSTLF
ncbi:MAG: prephenate dehydrogenase/arogenate dehydrogenase family protein, partial [Sphingopyxis sp.]